MFDSLLTKIFGSRNDRLVRQYRKKCAAVNKLEPQMQKLTDEELQHKTVEFRERLAKDERGLVGLAGEHDLRTREERGVLPNLPPQSGRPYSVDGQLEDLAVAPVPERH